MNWDDIIIDAADSDTGMRRSNNQDSHAAVRAPNKEVWQNRGHVFMVADGWAPTRSANLPARWPAT